MRVFSEEPIRDLWRLLLRYSYPANIERYLAAHDRPHPSELVYTIVGAVEQGHEYLTAAKSTSLNTSPLLVYYGLVSLCIATCCLLKGEIPAIKGHGLSLQTTDSEPSLEGVVTKTLGTPEGGFFQFSTILTSEPPSSHDWRFKDLLSWVPDLRSDFESCYRLPANNLPVEIVRRKDEIVERIEIREIPHVSNPEEYVSQRIPQFGKHYFAPQCTKKYLVLRPRSGIPAISYNSTAGTRHLILAHEETRKTLPLLVIFLIGTYTLGFLSRYKPSLWARFVRHDGSGERLLVERFLDITSRQAPNLLLNLLYDEEIYFDQGRDSVKDLSSQVRAEDIKSIVQEMLQRNVDYQR